MATSTVVPVNEYLRKSYRPDRDYVDGEVQERNLGGRDHADLRIRIRLSGGGGGGPAHVIARPELRVLEWKPLIPGSRRLHVLRKDAPRSKS